MTRLVGVVALLACLGVGRNVRHGLASWYSTAETRGRMANGEVLNDEAFTAASWDFSLGTRLRVRNQKRRTHQNGDNPKTNKDGIAVTVTDRGPARRLYRQGRRLDLSQAAFAALAPLSEGVISVSVEQVR